ncbi:hypothetical protein BRD11_04205 [Halobacteriales archaeon SW_12_69_24]|nr:MAG: hypothetical protein BRD11_04205 [Halobacteriales archaeon SW_12_69_24]
MVRNSVTTPSPNRYSTTFGVRHRTVARPSAATSARTASAGGTNPESASVSRVSSSTVSSSSGAGAPSASRHWSVAVQVALPFSWTSTVRLLVSGGGWLVSSQAVVPSPPHTGQIGVVPLAAAGTASPDATMTTAARTVSATWLSVRMCDQLRGGRYMLSGCRRCV